MTTAPVVTPPSRFPSPPGRAGFRHATRAEWTKFWSVRSTAWSLVFMIIAVLGLCVLATSTINPNEHIADPTRRSLIGTFLGQFAIGVLGVLVMSAEYGTGSIRSTLAALPRRPVVLAAKVVVFGAVALVVSEVLAFSAFFMGQALLSGKVPNAVLSDPGVTRAVVGSGLYLTVLGLLALGLATVIRHTAGSIAAYVGVVLVLPLIVGALPTSLVNAVSRYLPANIGLITLSTRTPDDLLGTPVFSPWMGLAILAGYAVAVLALGCVLLVRRDA